MKEKLILILVRICPIFLFFSHRFLFLADVLITGKFKASTYTKKGKEYFKFKGDDVQVDIGGIYIVFENLFKNNPELTDNTNRILNENSDVLYDEIKPVISKGISDLITAVFNNVHERFSVDTLYPK